MIDRTPGSNQVAAFVRARLIGGAGRAPVTVLAAGRICSRPVPGRRWRCAQRWSGRPHRGRLLGMAV